MYGYVKVCMYALVYTEYRSIDFVCMRMQVYASDDTHTHMY